MARLVFICPYLKGNTTYRGNIVNYIATREGVELQSYRELELPQTENRRELLEEIQSELVPFEEQSSDTRGILVSYIANRPGVQMLGTNGLFTMTDEKIVLSKVQTEVAKHEGNVWIPVISLKREDAEMFGYESADGWKKLLRAHSADIAMALKIHPDNLRWYAAYHDKDTHPHVHMVIYSTDPKEGYLTTTGIREIKSVLANDIFKPELLEYYEQKTTQRDVLKIKAKETLDELLEQMEKGSLENERIESLMIELSECLKKISGKKQYGYLSPRLKSMVDEITDELAKDTRVAEAYKLWHKMQNAVTSIYTDELNEPLPLSKQKEFKPLLNMIIREASELAEQAHKPSLEIPDNEVTEKEINEPMSCPTATEPHMKEEQWKKAQYYRQPVNAAPLLSSATRLLHNMGSIFRGTTPTDNDKAQLIDSKRRQELAKKRRAQGLKGRDLEQKM